MCKTTILLGSLAFFASVSGSQIQSAISQPLVRPLSLETFSSPYSPHWDAKTQSLYFADNTAKDYSIVRYDYKSGRYYRAAVIGDTGPTFILPLTCGKHLFLVGFAHAAKVIKWDGCAPYAEVVRTAFEVETGPETTSNHWHFGVADPLNRFYGSTFRGDTCGNSTAATGAFYRYGKQEGLQQIFGNVKVAGGIAFNTKRHKAYFVDTCRLTISEYSYKKSLLYGGRTLFDFRTADDPYPSILPTGITLDRSGNLFVTAYNGSTIYKLNPKTATQLDAISIPNQLVTGAVFGGPNLKTLFVTTARFAVQEYDGSVYEDTVSPLAGAIFRVDGLHTKGYAGRGVCV